MKLLIVIPQVPKHEPPECIQYDRIFEGNINARNRKEIYEWLKNEYGETCAYCGKTPQELNILPGKLDLDHVDGNSKRHYWRNLVLADHTCNCRKNAKNWRKKILPFSLSASILDKDMPEPTKAEMHLKKKYLRKFLDFLLEEFQDRDRVPLDRIKKVGRLRSGFPSKKTLEDYWEVISCEEGPLYEWPGGDGVDYARLRSITTLTDFKEKYCR